MKTHHYGPRVHILENPFLEGMLARLCSPDCHQPEILRIVEVLYTHLIATVVNQQFQTEAFSQSTRMSQYHQGLKLEGTQISTQNKAVCVNLARAGTFPSHLCYQFLHHILPSENIRQDHIFASRQTNNENQVTGTFLGSAKIGGGIDKAIVLFPDPMGATGNTIISSVEHYKKNITGTPARFIGLHLIVTPEYLKRVLQAHSDVVVYALRVDRGLSDPKILKEPLGKHWELEKGLNENDYIVPGGGGFGEIMNNSFV